MARRMGVGEKTESEVRGLKNSGKWRVTSDEKTQSELRCPGYVAGQRGPLRR